MNKLLSSKACREFLENESERALSLKNINFRDPCGCCKGRGSLARNGTPQGRAIYLMIGGISVATSFAAALLALRERNLYFMKKRQGPPMENIQKPVLDVQEYRENFMSGNRLHFVHSVGIIAAPYASRMPSLTTALFLSGIAAYSGAMYYRSFRREPKTLVSTLWVGGISLLIGWLSFLM